MLDYGNLLYLGVAQFSLSYLHAAARLLTGMRKKITYFFCSGFTTLADG